MRGRYLEGIFRLPTDVVADGFLLVQVTRMSGGWIWNHVGDGGRPRGACARLDQKTWSALESVASASAVAASIASRPSDRMWNASRALRQCFHDTGNEYLDEMKDACRHLDRSASVIDEMMSVFEDLKENGIPTDIDDRVRRWKSLLDRP